MVHTAKVIHDKTSRPLSSLFLLLTLEFRDLKSNKNSAVVTSTTYCPQPQNHPHYALSEPSIHFILFPEMYPFPHILVSLKHLSRFKFIFSRNPFLKPQRSGPPPLALNHILYCNHLFMSQYPPTINYFKCPLKTGTLCF